MKNENEIKDKNENLVVENKVFLKLEYFLFFKIYIIYLFFHELTYKNILNYSFLLNFQYIIGQVCMQNVDYYKIKYENNIYFLNNFIIYFFDFLLFHHIYFNNKIHYINKFFLIINIFLFQLGIIIHKLFSKRIQYLDLANNTNQKNKSDFEFLFLLPGLENIYNVVEKTKNMNESNFYIFLNILFIFLI
jgi:hypothetical protein